MSTVAQLTKPAAKLLLRYLETDGASEPPAQAMVEAGVSRTDYFEAKRLLQTLGFVDSRGNLLRFRSSVERQVEEDEPVAPAPVLRALPQASGLSEPDTDLPIRQRAMQADLMDDSGDWNSSNSPRRKRRLAQIKVVQDAWKELFPKDDLTSDNGKDFLAWNDDSAEAVLEAFADLKRRVDTGFVKSPLTWLRQKYVRRAKEAPKPQVRPVAVGAPAAAEEEVGLMDPSPAYLAKQERLRKLLAKQGRQFIDDDDE